jgi:predicted Zn-dependent peptidase
LTLLLRDRYTLALTSDKTEQALVYRYVILEIIHACPGCVAADQSLRQRTKERQKGAIRAHHACANDAIQRVRRDNLLNGFQIITLERPSDALLKCDIVLRAGAMFDLVDKVGQATLTQATLLAVNPRIKEEFESLNAKIDWGADWDTTWFHIESPAANFDTAMEILARLLVVENVRTDAFKQAQQARLDKFKTRQLTPAERADEAFSERALRRASLWPQPRR